MSVSWEQLLTGCAAIAGGLATGGVVGWMIVKHLFTDWIEWRDRVEAKIDKLDPDRMSQHYDRVHTLSNGLFEVKINVTRHEKTLEDHEHRIRGLENGGKS